MNIVVLSGRLTKNIELKTAEGGSAYTRFTLAVDRYLGKDKGTKTLFVDCVAFGHNANRLNKYCTKGSFVTVHGELDSNIKEYEGKKVTYWNVVCNLVEVKKDKAPQEAPQEAPQFEDFNFEDFNGDSNEEPFDFL